jgi:hypothetical protein
MQRKKGSKMRIIKCGSTQRTIKLLTTAAVFAAAVTAGSLIDPKSVLADNDSHGPQDEREIIWIGFEVAASSGIHLNMAHKDRDMVGLGSYLVNVVADCNGCHSTPQTTYVVPTGNPYFRSPPFSGHKQIDPTTYLGGGQDFGPFPSPDGSVHIVSRNLTPDKTGLPEGGHTLSEFITIMRTGVDMDHAHPNCSSPTETNCMLPPFNGALLQVMPWPAFQNMTDHQLVAIYEYLRAIPCLEGGPGEPPNRCK